MATFKYKVNPDDTLQLGDSSNTVSIPGTLTPASATVTGAITGATLAGVVVATTEAITTTGSGDVVDPAKRYSFVTSGGAHTVTLANGTVTGQEKTIILSVDGGTVTLTPAAFTDGTSLTFADALDTATLVWTGAAWQLAAASGVAVA